ncbi:hypothetical protein niasHS_003686 [Heterodera schachtii]|uniref:Uncharacterized protein n=1 Tax=Heterodera schachtii TaxID=97005 RepID=A0ABD2KH83_HETSC
MHKGSLVPLFGKNLRQNSWRAFGEKSPLKSFLFSKSLPLILLLIILLLYFQFPLNLFRPSDGTDFGRIISNGTFLAKFVDFQKRFSKNYSTIEEKLRRFSIFVANFEQLEKIGREGEVYGITTFFDWSDEELKELIMPHEHFENVPFAWAKPIREFRPMDANFKRPSEFDWRKKGVVNHVKNQMRCGACWAFATAAVVESQHAIHNGTLLILSEQQMIDCDQSNNGCEGGNRPNAFRYVRDNGLLREDNYPYRGADGNCELSPGPVDPTQRTFVDEVRTLPSDEQQIADFVVEKGPVSFGMNVTKTMFHYVGGIFSPTADECQFHSMGRHAMEVVGFGEDEKSGGTPFWIMKNSWGSSWGINGGYVHIRRGVDACGLSREVHTALITRY